MMLDGSAFPQIPDTASISMPRPKQPRPILVIGAGGIVRAAHLPAYRKAGFPVIGIMDQAGERADQVAADFAIPRAFSSLSEAVRYAPPDAVFDVAIPASQLLNVLDELPVRSAALMQKPMGETLAEADAIRALCRDRNLAAAVNFSLRYSPGNLAARALADAGLIGAIHDMEVQTTTVTPFHLWTFLTTAPRLEILYHSIHYFDLIRSWLGNPRSVAARTVRSPQMDKLAPTRTVAILDYGDDMRVFVATNHSHDFGSAHRNSYVQWEGTLGAARMTMGVTLDYQSPAPDRLEFARRGWRDVSWNVLPLGGNTFPDGFIGTMGSLQAWVEGSAPSLPTHFEDAWQTMALVEALYESSEHGAAWTPGPSAK